MTPEEKLLALIQQDKKPAEATGGRPTPDPSKEGSGRLEPTANATAGTAVATSEVSKVGRGAEGPVADKKLKLAVAESKATGNITAGTAVATQHVGGEPTPGPSKEGRGSGEPTPGPSKEGRGSGEPTPGPSKEGRGSGEPTPGPSKEGRGSGEPTGQAKEESKAEGSGYRKPILRPGRLSGLVLFNRVLTGVVLVLLVVVVYSVASIRADVMAEGEQLKAGVGAHHVVAATVINDSLPSVDVFLDKVSPRNVFLPVDARAATSTVAVLQGKVADLKLLGVSIDSTTDQESMAIIRNKAESRTYFIKKGQMVGDTGYTLERVLGDRAVLKQGKQEIELK